MNSQLENVLNVQRFTAYLYFGEVYSKFAASLLLGQLNKIYLFPWKKNRYFINKESNIKLTLSRMLCVSPPIEKINKRFDLKQLQFIKIIYLQQSNITWQIVKKDFLAVQSNWISWAEIKMLNITLWK